MLYYLLIYLVKPFYWVFRAPRVEGRRNMISLSRVIFACNHLSMTDPILLALISPRVIRFMAKKELFDSPLGGLFFRSLLVFPVNRHHADLASLKGAISLLERGQAIGIFPEGHRSVTLEVDELEGGVAFLALRTKTPIVPIYIDPQERKKHHVRVVVGEPISVEDVLENVERSARINVVNNRLAAALDRLSRKEPENQARVTMTSILFHRGNK